jgi:predicted peptidase
MKPIVGFALALCACLPAAFAADEPQAGKQQPQKFEKQVTIHLDYLAYVPKDYDKDPGKKWPLIVFLHGAGERGTEIEKVKVHGPPKIAEAKALPFVIVSPQCPPEQWWDVPVLSVWLDEVMSKYRVDPDRVYLTGLSMGGFGTWSWAEAHPKRFAAIAPICGGGDAFRARALRNTPVWCFHGEKDPTVPIRASEQMVEAVKNAGNNDVKFTRYPEAGHDSWTATYDNPELYEWFLQHHRSENASAVATR